MPPGMLGVIGSTPVVRLEHLVEPGMAEVWVKLESHNPTGSYKDRMALAMIEGAERDGRLRPGQTVVEYTGGSTGSSLAYVCALKGNPLRMLDGYGALAHELLEQLDRRIDAFCAYVGTAGCFVGVTRELRSALPDLLRVAIEPAESPVLSGGEPGTHRIEGGGAGFWPPLLERNDFDEVMTVPTEDACAMARRAAQEEGLWSGPSTGANLTVALEVARRLGPRTRVVTPLVGSGLKYLAGDVYA